jgi:hypothetical protein
MPTINIMPTEIVRSFLLCVLAAMLATVGFWHFRDGVAEDAAIPIPVYMISHNTMPKVAYIDAAFALAMADPKNGIATLQKAEALMRAGNDGRKVVDDIEAGLTRAPASSRGWTLLSEALYPTNKAFAARALAQALILAPREYWLVGPQILDAARLWSELDSDTRQLALAKARLMWSENVLHPHLKTVVATPEGAALMVRSLSSDEIRALNRWLIQERSRESRL